ncbi:MAG TPA: arginine deiminase-related protein [Jatrophihabitans sp.]|nr:arginine deiminase-related protein [Jatrophihabitans sp.]
MTTARIATRRRYLMCRPTHFDVVYSINPWMDPAKSVDRQRAIRQWQRIHDLFVELGHQVELVDPLPGLPDMVFAANGATVVDDRVLVARFRHAERAGEAAAYLDWFGERGFDVRQSASVNEGQGDFLAVGDILLAGTGFRSDRGSHSESRSFFGRRVVGLTLVKDTFYHLDTALTVLDQNTVAYYPAAFDAPSRAVLEQLFPDAILATDRDAAAFGLNAVSDGRYVVLPSGATELVARLRERGFVPINADVSELLRGGGGVKCCTLELGRADVAWAAATRTTAA